MLSPKSNEEVLKSHFQDHNSEDNISNIKRNASFRNILNPVNPVLHDHANINLTSSITQAVIQQLLNSQLQQSISQVNMKFDNQIPAFQSNPYQHVNQSKRDLSENSLRKLRNNCDSEKQNIQESRQISIVHHLIGLRFKGRETKYSGEDDENLQEAIDHYVTASRDYSLSETQKLQYFHNIFRGDALHFYHKNIENRGLNFITACDEVQNVTIQSKISKEPKQIYQIFLSNHFLKKKGRFEKYGKN